MIAPAETLRQLEVTPIFAQLVNYYDPNRNLVHSLHASEKYRPLSEAFLYQVAEDRSAVAINALNEMLQQDGATGADIMLADSIEAGIDHPAFAEVLGLTPERYEAIRTLVHRRADSVAQSILFAAQTRNPDCFDSQGIPTNLDGFVAVGREVAYLAHMYSGTDKYGNKDGSIEMRRNKLPYWTHIEGVSFWTRLTIAHVRPTEAVSQQGSRQIVASGHDGPENTTDKDSGQWFYQPAFISPMVIRRLAEITAAAYPKATGQAVGRMTRTRGIDNSRANYDTDYMVRGLSGLHLKGNSAKDAIRSSQLFVTVKASDQRYNTVDNGRQRQLEDYLRAQAIMLETTSGSWLADYINHVGKHTMESAFNNLANMLGQTATSRLTHLNFVEHIPAMIKLQKVGARLSSAHFEEHFGLPASRR